MKKIRWLLIAVLSAAMLLMVTSALADDLPALQVQLTSATVTRGDFVEVEITNLSEYFSFRFNDEYRIVARAEGGYLVTENYACNDWGIIRIPTQSLDPAELSEEDQGQFRVVVTAYSFDNETYA